jgi:arginyl-tRNA synthetase
MTYDLRELTATVIADTFGVEASPEFTRPPADHGDFSTNVAMQLSTKLGKPPREIADKIKEVLESRADFEITVAGPGFINIRLGDSEVFAAAMQSTVLAKPLAGKVIVTEYSDPNPFKVLHAGHLYTTLVGDAISNILETAGADVKRTNFGGDVGLHVGKAMWGILKHLGGEYPGKLESIPDDQRSLWLSQRYVEGNTAYENDETARAAIVEINQRVYRLHNDNDHESAFAQVYWTCRQWSYEGFEQLYAQLKVKPFDKYYPESATTPLGLETVQKGLKEGVFEESDGAVIFRGEPHGLHTRVFINSNGLPTYEAKDVGLIFSKWNDYHFDQSVIITADDIIEYMKVVLKAIEQIDPKLSQSTVHLTHGLLKLAGGAKMSSRKGSILLASDILAAAAEAAAASVGQDHPDITLGAVRYSFLKNRIGGDIVYSPNESVSLEGNSGPYLQYALVRARSILRKIEDIQPATEIEDLDPLERNLARLISMYPEAFAAALTDYSPHHIAGYLYELAVTFNRFYEGSRVIGHERSASRVALVQAYERTLSHGLTILGMPLPEKM